MYQSLIAKDIVSIRARRPRYKDVRIDPRWVEAYMREEHGTLDHLPKRVFMEESLQVMHALSIGEATPEMMESWATSMGL